MLKVTRTSPFTGATHTREIPCTEEQYLAWKQGELIQNAMPNVSPEDREFIMTGITASDWDNMFGEAQ